MAIIDKRLQSMADIVGSIFHDSLSMEIPQKRDIKIIDYACIQITAENWINRENLLKLEELIDKRRKLQEKWTYSVSACGNRHVKILLRFTNLYNNENRNK